MAAQSAGTVIAAASDPQELIVFSLEAEAGRLVERHRVPIPSDLPPETGGGLPLALSPDRKFLYGVLRQQPHPIVCFALDPSGATAPRYLGSSFVPRRPAQMAVDETGRFLFSASYGDHALCLNPVGADGIVLPPTQIIDTPPQTHGVALAPGNRDVYVASMQGDVVVGFRFDAGSGRIDETPFLRSPSAPGAGPRHMVFGAEGRRLYVLTEHHASVIVYDRDPDTGALSERQCLSMLPELMFQPAAVSIARQPPGAADLRLTPDGTMLFTSDRVTDTVAAFAVDAASGLLTPLSSSPVHPTPRSIAIDPSGRFLISLGVWEGTITLYRIGPAGELIEAFSQKAATTIDWVEAIG